MLYNIEINQYAAVKLGLHLKLKPQDFIIFSFIRKFSISSKCVKQVFNNETYYLFNWKLIKEQLPLLGLNTRQSIKKRMDKLEEVGIIKAYKNNQAARSQFFTFTPLSDALYFYDHSKEVTTNVYTSDNERLHARDNERLHYNNDNNNNDNLKELKQIENLSSLHNQKRLSGDEAAKWYLDFCKKQDEKKKEKSCAKKEKLEDLEYYSETIKILELFTELTGVDFRPPKSVSTFKRYGAYKKVKTLLKSGFKCSEIEDIVKFKCKEWLKNPQMAKHCNYSTILLASNFEKYTHQIQIKAKTTNEQTNNKGRKAKTTADLLAEIERKYEQGGNSAFGEPQNGEVF